MSCRTFQDSPLAGAHELCDCCGCEKLDQFRTWHGLECMAAQVAKTEDRTLAQQLPIMK